MFVDVSNWPRWAALCAAGLLCACPASGDDDDFVGDDDDAVGDDDDAGDDDDLGFSFESVTLRGSLVAFAVGDDDDSVANDDDAVDDDDSAVGDDDDSGAGVTVRDAAEIEGTFVIDYWRDFDDSLLECTQTLTWSGTADFGAGLVSDCSGCTGVLELAAATVVDASNRATDPEACDPADLAAAGVDFGARLTGAGGTAAGGGLLQIGLMDLATAVDLDVQPTLSGDLDLVAQAEQIGATGNVLTHVGFVSSAGGTFFDDIDFDTVAGPSGAGEPWSVFWFVYRPDPTGSPPETDLSGAYQLGSFWILQ